MASIADSIAYFDKLLDENKPKPDEGKLRVRTLNRDEPLPNLSHNFQPGTVLPQHNWIWLVERDSKPIVMLIAAPAQTSVFLMSLAAAADSLSDNSQALMLLFRTALADMLKRGYPAFWVNLEPARPLESKLLSIIKRLPNVKLIENCTLAIGPTNIGVL